MIICRCKLVSLGYGKRIDYLYSARLSRACVSETEDLAPRSPAALRALLIQRNGGVALKRPAELDLQRLELNSVLKPKAKRMKVG